MLEQRDRQALGRGPWTGKLMSLCDCNGAQGIRNVFLWSAFQIILNSLIYFPTRGGTEAREPQSSPRGVQSYYVLTRLAHTLLLGPAPLGLGKARRTMSWFKANFRVQLNIFFSLNLFRHDCLKAGECLILAEDVSRQVPELTPPSHGQDPACGSQPAQRSLLWEVIWPRGSPGSLWYYQIEERQTDLMPLSQWLWF